MRKNEEEKLYEYVDEYYKKQKISYKDDIVEVSVKIKEKDSTRKFIYNKKENSLTEIVKKHNKITRISVKKSKGITYASIDDEKNQNILNYQIDTELSLIDVLIGLKDVLKAEKANKRIYKELKKLKIEQNQIASKIDKNPNKNYLELAGELDKNQVQQQKVMKKIKSVPYENDLSSVVKKPTI